MKQLFYLFTVCLLGICSNVYSQGVVRNNYGDGKSKNLSLASALSSSTQLVGGTNDDVPIMTAVFGNYTDYDKNAWGAEALMVSDQNVGFQTGVRYQHIGDYQNFLWLTFGLNYALNIVDKDDTKLFLVGSFDLGFDFADVPNNTYSGSDFKFYLDGIITPRLVLKLNHVALSAGYQWTAHKFKFKKYSVQDGFTLGVGYAF